MKLWSVFHISGNKISIAGKIEEKKQYVDMLSAFDVLISWISGKTSNLLQLILWKFSTYCKCSLIKFAAKKYEIKIKLRTDEKK